MDKMKTVFDKKLNVIIPGTSLTPLDLKAAGHTLTDYTIFPDRKIEDAESNALGKLETARELGITFVLAEAQDMTGRMMYEIHKVLVGEKEYKEGFHIILVLDDPKHLMFLSDEFMKNFAVLNFDGTFNEEYTEKAV